MDGLTGCILACGAAIDAFSSVARALVVHYDV